MGTAVSCWLVAVRCAAAETTASINIRRLDSGQQESMGVRDGEVDL